MAYSAPMTRTDSVRFRRSATAGPASPAALILLGLALQAAPVAAQAPPAEFVPVTDAMLRDPAPEDWLMWRRTLDGWGFRSRCLITS